ncbi:MAG: peptide-methionine (S)-S-oxide reductase MsrA [Gemmatimonadota bacterium]|nr:peptide-methionine (S)-S-oxide reductase MsrA [Gemmatimonadota bacterium]
MTGGTAIATATFGGGCFWCTEAVFERVPGVEEVIPGYAGGHEPDPSYRQVCGGGTGHAEVVQVRFDPGRVAFRRLLEIFFATHDPTTRDRQGADVGSQYRSIVLAHDEEQERTAREVIAALEADGAFPGPIVTEVRRLDEFWPAEEEHRGFYRRNPTAPYCAVVIAPKLAKLQRGA